MADLIAPTKRRAMTKARAARIFLKADGRCELCGQRIAGEYEIEHRIPLNLGGADDDENCAPVHAKCHRRKTATDKADIAKRNRVVTAGWKGKAKGRGFKCSKDSPFKQKIGGGVVYRDTGEPVGKGKR
jgi:5-methylcytosine-specific restriction enzyme A